MNRVVRCCAIMVIIATAGLLAAQIRQFNPVTEEMLRNPSPNDWLNWRRTDNAWGYSPLDQINRNNVKQLQLAWAFPMQGGWQEPTPLVHDGVMYMPNAGSVVDALDASSGDMIWEYRRNLPKFSLPGHDSEHQLLYEPMRNLSIFEDKIFLGTADAHMIALDARTGEVVWDTQASDYKDGLDYRAGTVVARGKVIGGLVGCGTYVESKCALIAHDAGTGKELWRVFSVAKPGEPGGNTWSDLPLLFRSGGDMWITGSYDPTLNLVYWGTAQAKPWARISRHTDGDALFTDSTIAVNPDTGKMLWYHQYLPGETEDMDDVFEKILVDSPEHKSLFEMGKLGILWEIDRQTGKFIHATDLGYQNLVDVAPDGKVTYRPGKIPVADRPIDFCPSYGGIKNWQAMAYHPESRAFYIPTHPFTCETATYPVEKLERGGGGSGGVKQVMRPNPLGDGNGGVFIAMDTSGKILWKHAQRASYSTSALTTAGGLVFVGDNRNVYAFEVKTGALLWQTKTMAPPTGFVTTYSAGGRQFIAIPVGNRFIAGAPRLNTGNAILVYALPEAVNR